jgi:hypothetical protein
LPFISFLQADRSIAAIRYVETVGLWHGRRGSLQGALIRLILGTPSNSGHP